MNLPEPDTAAALEYLEDWDRLGLTGPRANSTERPAPTAGAVAAGHTAWRRLLAGDLAAEVSPQPHVCDDQCQPSAPPRRRWWWLW